MDFSIGFFAAGQMLPGTLAVPCAAIAAARPTLPVTTRARRTGVRFIDVFEKPVNQRSGANLPYFSAGTSLITIPGVEADSPTPVPAPVGFCNST